LLQNISHGSVATQLGCGGICNKLVITLLQISYRLRQCLIQDCSKN